MWSCLVTCSFISVPSGSIPEETVEDIKGRFFILLSFLSFGSCEDNQSLFLLLPKAALAKQSYFGLLIRFSFCF